MSDISVLPFSHPIVLMAATFPFMSNISRFTLKSALTLPLTLGALSGALLLSPLPARAQDAPGADAAVTPTTTAWTTFKGDPQRTGSSAAPVRLPLTLQWRFSSVGPARTYTTAPLVIGAPGNQRAVFASGSVVYATDINTGAQIWKSPDTSSNIIVPLALLPTDDGDLILALQNSGRLTALKTADGGRAWEVDCGALATESGPVVVKTNKGTRVICALNTGRMVAVDAAGVIDKDWKLQLGSVGTSAASSMALSRDGSRLFILGSDARLYIINVREARILYSLPQASRSGVTPVASGDVVYTANARRVAAWRISDGVANWTISPTGDVVGSPALMLGEAGGNAGATLFFGTRDSQFMAVDAATGKIKWQKTLADNVSLTGSPLVVSNMVLVGTSAGTLVGFNPADGAIVWQYRLQTERVADLDPDRGRRGRRGGFDGGGGFEGGGFEGGGAPDGTTTADAPKRSYGVSSAPAAVNGKVLVLGDNAALYAFTSQSFDADPPRIVEPSIAVNATDRQLISLLLTTDQPPVVPGVGPFYFATQIDDVGSGIDPSSITVTINDKPVDATRVYYGRASGVLTVTLVDPAKADPTLPDGLKKMVITAKDYAGNTTSFSANFLVDNTAPAPAPPIDETLNNGEGGPGGGFDGGGGFVP